MTLTLDELITEAEKSVALAEATLQSLRREKLNQTLASLPEDIETRFWAWCESGVPDNNHGWIFHCVSSSGKNLFEYGSYIHWERREIIDLERVADSLGILLEDMSDERYRNRISCTKQDVLDWMKILMDDNFASCLMDW